MLKYGGHYQGSRFVPTVDKEALKIRIKRQIVCRSWRLSWPAKMFLTALSALFGLIAGTSHGASV